jgi:hypothetical protein
VDPEEGAFSKKSVGPDGDDFVDPNNPFVQENPFVPGGILANYKKRSGLTA